MTTPAHDNHRGSPASPLPEGSDKAKVLDNHLETCRFALAVEILLVLVHDLFPAMTQFLPIGGSHSTQIGVVLMIAYVMSEIRAHLKPRL